ncbi:MAG: DMT family transporter [SAR202 cluster bacterium]|nr:MAG: DMT family transporter [SAR202 cluster bacterium]
MGESLALLNAVIWALTGVVTKGVGRDVRPIHIVTTQVWVGFLFLIGIGLVTGYLDDLAEVQIRSALYLAGGALVNTAGSLVFWQAITRSTVSKVYPTTQSIFISISVLAGWLFLGDSPQIGVVGGAILIIGGVILLNRKPEAAVQKSANPSLASERGSRGDYIGLGLAGLTSILWAVGFLSTVVGLQDTPPVLAATIRNFVPAILFIPIVFVIPSSRVSRVFKRNGTRLILGAVLFVGSSLTFVLALDNAPPGVVVVLINTSPMWAVVLAMVLLKERLDRYGLAGAVLSVAGIFVTLAFR